MIYTGAFSRFGLCKRTSSKYIQNGHFEKKNFIFNQAQIIDDSRHLASKQ